MKAKIILLALLLSACWASGAWAGWIAGDITFTNCNCDIRYQWVCIKLVSGGPCYHIPVICSPGAPHYITYPTNIPAGTYHISVVLEGGDCDVSFIQTFVHGDANEFCDLKVVGPAPNPTGPDPGP